MVWRLIADEAFVELVVQASVPPWDKPPVVRECSLSVVYRRRLVDLDVDGERVVGCVEEVSAPGCWSR